MAQQHINTGSQPNNGTGDTIRAAFRKTENNFTDIYSKLNVFPYTASVTDPAQIQGASGANTILGVTGSISVTNDISASAIRTDKIVAKRQSTTEMRLGIGSQRFFLGGQEFINLNANSTPFSMTFNPDGLNLDFNIKDESDNSAFFADSSTARIGINTTTPQTTLHVNGDIRANGLLITSGNIQDGDPSTSGELFFTASEAIAPGNPGFSVICISP